jgi:hypothetical protein
MRVVATLRVWGGPDPPGKGSELANQWISEWGRQGRGRRFTRLTRPGVPVPIAECGVLGPEGGTGKVWEALRGLGKVWEGSAPAVPVPIVAGPLANAHLSDHGPTVPPRTWVTLVSVCKHSRGFPAVSSGLNCGKIHVAGSSISDISPVSDGGVFLGVVSRTVGFFARAGLHFEAVNIG